MKRDDPRPPSPQAPREASDTSKHADRPFRGTCSACGVSVESRGFGDRRKQNGAIVFASAAPQPLFTPLLSRSSLRPSVATRKLLLDYRFCQRLENLNAQTACRRPCGQSERPQSRSRTRSHASECMQTGQGDEHGPLLTVTYCSDAILVDMEQSSSTPLTNRLLSAVEELPVNGASLSQIIQARHHWDGRILDELAPWRAVAEFEVRQCLDRLAEVVADDVKTQIVGLRERPLGAPLYTLLVSSPLAPKKMPRAAIRLIRDHSDLLVTNPYCAARALAGLLADQEDSSLWASWWPPSDSGNSNALKIANALNTIVQGIINGPPVDLPPLPARYRHAYVPSSQKRSSRKTAPKLGDSAIRNDLEPHTDPPTSARSQAIVHVDIVREQQRSADKWRVEVQNTGDFCKPKEVEFLYLVCQLHANTDVEKFYYDGRAHHDLNEREFGSLLRPTYLEGTCVSRAPSKKDFQRGTAKLVLNLSEADLQQLERDLQRKPLTIGEAARTPKAPPERSTAPA